MKPRDIAQIIRIGAWLHLVTVVFILSKWAGLLPMTWIMVFLPSLLYGTFTLFLAGGYIIFVLGNPAIRHRVPTMASSNPRS
jgi:hypothetical protein